MAQAPPDKPKLYVVNRIKRLQVELTRAAAAIGQESQ